jgi:hypothetical protein
MTVHWRFRRLTPRALDPERASGQAVRALPTLSESVS